jgi:molybdate transport system substrate-binding protein
VARNRLALVGPADSPLQVALLKKFPTAALINQMGGEQAFVVGNPETLMAGIYGKEALRKLNVADDLEPYTLYIRQMDEMFDMVLRQHAYGIFLYSSTINQAGLRVLDVLPENSHRPIAYYAVVIAGDNMNEARKFLEYLKTADAKKIFRENGFSVD